MRLYPHDFACGSITRYVFTPLQQIVYLATLAPLHLFPPCSTLSSLYPIPFPKTDTVPNLTPYLTSHQTPPWTLPHPSPYHIPPTPYQSINKYSMDMQRYV